MKFFTKTCIDDASTRFLESQPARLDAVCMDEYGPFFDPAELDRQDRAGAAWIHAREAAGFDMSKCFPMRRLAARRDSRDAENHTMKT